MHHLVRRPLAVGGVAALVSGAILATPGMAAAADPCQGQAVTIDGTGQATVTGTAGDDVIAASVGATVNALAGADTICILPGTAGTATTVDAGDGADSVDTAGIPAALNLTTRLGAGNDTYTGGVADDTVFTGAGDDTVTTAAGDDSVDSGVAGEDNGDTIDLGAGDDALTWHGTQTPAGSVDVGAGADSLVVPDGGVVAIDANDSTLDRDGATVLTWSGDVATYVVESSATSAMFAGTNAAETFVLRDPAAGATPTTVDVDLGGGDDTATARSAALDGSQWKGGEGTDTLENAYEYDMLRIDLSKGRMETGKADVTRDQGIPGFEDVVAASSEIRVKGTDGPNTLALLGCDVTGIGRAGADVISYGADLDQAPTYTCRPEMTAKGGKGDDTITGSAGADRLFGLKDNDIIEAEKGPDLVVGGPGKDRLDGSRGKDKIRGGPQADQLGGFKGDDVLLGNKGYDRLLGQGGRDKLVGGPGYDQANGGNKRDTCIAEKRRRCEAGR